MPSTVYEAPTTSVSESCGQEAFFDNEPLPYIPEGVEADRGLNELRRRLRENLRWAEDRLRRVKAALELLEDDEAYQIYAAIHAAR